MPTPDGIARTLQVPILMYHYISTPPDPRDRLRVDLSVPPERFREHLSYLRQAGYQTISLHELLLALQIGQPLPPKPIVLTFDDGYLDNYTNAYPLLREAGYMGTFFILTSMADMGHPDYVTWDQVMEMHAAGMQIESHGYSHTDLRRRSEDYLVWQVLGSQEAIEARIGQPVRFFCYPSGGYDAQVIEVLQATHYWGAVTIHSGITQRSEAPFEMERLRVRGWHTAENLAALLAAYEQEAAP
jgi:peptidoglycan/xylan/chitin deacetylase (PgdA/CDA1 family)